MQEERGFKLWDKGFAGVQYEYMQWFRGAGPGFLL